MNAINEKERELTQARNDCENLKKLLNE